MKKVSLVLIALSCMCLVLMVASVARAENADTAVSQLGSELQQSKVVTQKEADAIKPELKNMIESGATKEELKSVVTELSDKGVKGDELRSSLGKMKDLVREGENPKEAGSVVSRAAAEAHAQGLKGKDLAAKVHEAIQLRKSQKAEVKEKAEKAKKKPDEAKKKADEAKKKADEAKKKAVKVKKETREKTEKINKEARQKGKKRLY